MYLVTKCIKEKLTIYLIVGQNVEIKNIKKKQKL